MANIDAPFGLRPIAKVGQNPNNGGQTQYDVGGSQSTAIFTGDPVKYKNDGTVEVATASDALLGVFMGGFYTDPTTQKPTFKNYYPGSIVASDIIANVIDDPNVVYKVDSDGAFAVADIFKNFSVTNVTGNTQTGISKVQLDYSVSGTTGTFVIQAIDISQDPDNDEAGAANGDILVRINNHFYRQGGTGL